MSFRILDFTCDYEGFKKTYINVIPDGPVTGMDQVEKALRTVATFLRESNLLPLQEKIYAPLPQHKIIQKARKNIFADTEVPVTFIEGRPCQGGIFSGLQMIAISIMDSKTVSLRPVSFKDRDVGRIFENEDFRWVFLSGVGNQSKAAPYDQARAMFHRTFEILKEQKMAPADLRRTWIYLPDILEWYGDFNKARKEAFKVAGLIPGEGVYFPASTGVQGRRYFDEHCFMDAVAFQQKSKGVSCRPMRSSRQKEAKEYGSLFSRGMAISVEERKTLYISGTASINPEGKTVYCGDHQGQIVETILNVMALLQTENAGKQNIVQATVFCKTEENYQQFAQISNLLEIGHLPLLPIYADICRDNLLVEMEVIGQV